MPHRHPIATLRAITNLTQQKLASHIGVTRAHLAKVETFKLPVSEELAIRIARLTGADIPIGQLSPNKRHEIFELTPITLTAGGASIRLPLDGSDELMGLKSFHRGLRAPDGPNLAPLVTTPETYESWDETAKEHLLYPPEHLEDGRIEVHFRPKIYGTDSWERWQEWRIEFDERTRAEIAALTEDYSSKIENLLNAAAEVHKADAVKRALDQALAEIANDFSLKIDASI